MCINLFMMFWHLKNLADQRETAPSRAIPVLEIAKGLPRAQLSCTNQPIPSLWSQPPPYLTHIKSSRAGYQASRETTSISQSPPELFKQANPKLFALSGLPSGNSIKGFSLDLPSLLTSVKTWCFSYGPVWHALTSLRPGVSKMTSL